MTSGVGPHRKRRVMVCTESVQPHVDAGGIEDEMRRAGSPGLSQMFLLVGMSTTCIGEPLAEVHPSPAGPAVMSA